MGTITQLDPLVVATRSDLAAARDAMTGSVAVVMTMGSLHDGHLALVRRAHAEADHVIVTIFVNPLQFGPAEDFATYPRDHAADLAMLATAGGADVVFFPGERDVYPDGRPGVTISAGRAGAVLEGRSRPGHFDGVLTVVAILLNLTRPHIAIFGEKDAQQVALVRLMVDQLAFGVHVVAVATVREPDGLARSSRNINLTPHERRAAAVVPAALEAARAASAVPGGDPAAARAAALDRLVASPGVAVDYVAVVDPVTFEEFENESSGERPPLLVVAVRVGRTRLIDNTALTASSHPHAPTVTSWGSETIR